MLVMAMLLVTMIQAQTGSDLIIVNAKVLTMDPANPRAEAVVVRNQQIVFAGSVQAALKLKKKHTKMIDAGGRTLIPGLFDTHLHVIRGGRFYNTELRWDGVPTLARALTMLREQAQRTPKGQWVRVVGGWNEYQFAERRLPTLKEINEATGDVPTFILYLYGKAWLNKAGLALLGIDGSSPNPPGGLIEKDDAGNATGLLVAEPNAFILYSTLAKLPELTTAEKINSTLQYMTELNRLGVTAVMDAGGGFQNFPDDYAITDSLNKLGQITVRLPYFLFAQKKGTELSDYQRWTGMVDIEHHSTQGVDYAVAGGGENLVADAADFENFLFPRPELPASMENNLKAVISLLVRKRWPFRLHATYNESISRDLDVIEAVNRETPLNGLLWIIDHAETISEENMKRVKALGGAIAIQHRMAYQGESFIHRYGKKAAETAPPVRRMMELGIPVALGTDGTRVASYNPWVAFYWFTTGKTIGGTQVMAANNTIDRLTALHLFTVGGYELLREKNKGMIRAGYLADLVLLNQDLEAIPDEALLKLQSVLTLVDGKIVFGQAPFAQWAPAPLPVIPAWSPVAAYGGYQY
jgi:predicted amidohydrolase YtcJ